MSEQKLSYYVYVEQADDDIYELTDTKRFRKLDNARRYANEQKPGLEDARITIMAKTDSEVSEVETIII